MEERKKTRDDDAPTDPEDWIGAAVVNPNDEKRPLDGNAMMFHVYRSSKDSSTFAITNKSDTDLLPPCPKGGEWKLFKKFWETGQKRIGFSEKAARKDIERQGYHPNNIDIEVTVG